MVDMYGKSHLYLGSNLDSIVYKTAGKSDKSVALKARLDKGALKSKSLPLPG